MNKYFHTEMTSWNNVTAMVNKHILPSNNYPLKRLPRSTDYWVLSTTLNTGLFSLCILATAQVKTEVLRTAVCTGGSLPQLSAKLESRKAIAPALHAAFCYKMSTHETKILSKPSLWNIQVDSFWQANSTLLFISVCHADLRSFPGPMQG